MSFLLDTCVISEFVKPQPNPSVTSFIAGQDEAKLFLSAVTVGEIQRGIQKLPVGKKQAALLLWMDAVEIQFENRVLAFDKRCAGEWARMCTEAEAAGFPLAAFDSIIAAIARSHSMTLVTRNTTDFVHTGVPLINPWEL
ncbi:MAG: type II toxin-antitoxin system VapC family toxin [Deltaproteobacteria bacterium]|nr:type II toxin-antitoxin system VapC family toxin [Deltaproteobacteria bacterium]